MQFQTTFFFVFPLLAALPGALASPANAVAKGMEAREALTALDPISACGCPNNCKKKVKDSCAFIGGSSGTNTKINGKCTVIATGELYCIE